MRGYYSPSRFPSRRSGRGLYEEGARAHCASRRRGAELTESERGGGTRRLKPLLELLCHDEPARHYGQYVRNWPTTRLFLYSFGLSCTSLYFNSEQILTMFFGHGSWLRIHFSLIFPSIIPSNSITNCEQNFLFSSVRRQHGT